MNLLTCLALGWMLGMFFVEWFRLRRSEAENEEAGKRLRELLGGDKAES